MNPTQVSFAELSPEAQALVALGRAVRTRIHAGRAHAKDWSDVAAQAASDLQYGIDRFSEEGLVEAVSVHCHALLPLLLMSEGLPEQGIRVGEGAPRWLLMLDPIDGTRGLMHDKRSAFFLAGLAPVNDARLATLCHAAMIELPTTRSPLSDVLAADADGTLFACTDEIATASCTSTRPLLVQPSRAVDLRHGFATVVRFFAGAAERLGAFHDALLQELHPDDPQAHQDAFEDQYISNAGQMHALITGRDRFVADLRPLVSNPIATTATSVVATHSVPLRCAHPYDLLGLLVARAAGVAITDAHGAPLDAPLDITTRVAWIGYANSTLRHHVEPCVHRALFRTLLHPRKPPSPPQNHD